jgi:hypothetical protein
MCTLHSATNQPGLPTHFCNAPNLASATIHRGQPFMPYVQNPSVHTRGRWVFVVHSPSNGGCPSTPFQRIARVRSARTTARPPTTNDVGTLQRRAIGTALSPAVHVRHRASPNAAERPHDAGTCANARCPTDAGGGERRRRTTSTRSMSSISALLGDIGRPLFKVCCARDNPVWWQPEGATLWWQP